jgi:hypothetical protein
MSVSLSRLRWFWELIVCALVPLPTAAQQQPLKLHPENPHYFLFRGKPAILISSGEHYGAVLNKDFNYMPYMDELRARGFNLTRTFSGTYRENPGAFKIVDNTLAPAPGKFVCPWKRVAATNGKTNFDLNSFDPVYFKRLRDFLTQAGQRGIVVELTLFCTIYDDALWRINPMNPHNNINDLGRLERQGVYTTRNAKLLALQSALVRRIAAEVKDFDNVYFEVCNEPYFGGVTRDWTDHIIAAIVEAESRLGVRHLIAQNISNGSTKIRNPNRNVSIFNFHYSAPPDSVTWNRHLNRPIGNDETGFKGTADLSYRTEGWDFILAGGAVYSNLDYSFSCAHPDGSGKVTTSPGGGGPGLRRQLQLLKEFIEGFDFIHMEPNNTVIKSRVPKGASVRALVQTGKAYAVYIKGGTRADLTLELPAGSYRVDWLHPGTGQLHDGGTWKHAGGSRTISSPAYAEDIALRVLRTPG